MKQFILNSKPDKDSIIKLYDNDYRYLVRVRRLAVGEFFPALLPDGQEALIEILSIKQNVLTGKCVPNHDSPPSYFESKNIKTDIPPIILFQALPKSDKMDLIVRQAAEGGITEIVPFISEYSVAKTVSGSQKFTRWDKIIKEARQQSGSKTATSIRRSGTGNVLSINELFDYWKNLKENILGLLFHHQGLEQKPLHSYLNIIPKMAVMAIGPEGGFSVTEVSLFLEHGFKPFTIGDTVLRTETAALYCAAAVKILLLERDLWELKQAK